jgi:hypothetical protein
MAELILWPFQRDEKDEPTNQEPVKRPKITAKEEEKEAAHGRTRGEGEWVYEAHRARFRGQPRGWPYNDNNELPTIGGGWKQGDQNADVRL